ncbi:type IV pilus modification PilV family protein [Propionivibrio dicarboxylicus]|uniref:MSHA pilin protein MshD n=1 Tax=Propionivibrio dicarboxylicus TaxID=83767 RepID=A0A1G8IJC7_9RHOO|nr:prepilin-type N-terminal cleavage/methylation domain-containing protein [Propionivibrio dicarboxylicus]SDI19005.1 MSHA pilin protein MshD [Propionivibrio dicarboxylicus]
MTTVLPSRHAGMTLIELIVFIVIVSVALVGVLAVLNVTVFRSSDPVVQKQAQALAEGLLEEIQTGYFAYADGADVALKYTKPAALCTELSSASDYAYGPEAGETRPYDTVKDYVTAANSDTPLGSVLPNESAISAPSGYAASVKIGPAQLGDISAACGDALLITVTVTAGSVKAVAEGFKTRQVPQ